ncbi:MAG: mannitol dehydrogenase family protein [Planctomycetota bacterium]|jgi:D-arabinitol 4-dehydrogenase|nr:mannitol dehydrogenase family protein [Planctomycetota bacterium]
MAKEKRVWLHIGAGSFHRAHQARYLHRLIESGDDAWTIALGNVRDDTTPMLEKLARQGGRYTLETVDSAGRREYELITSIRKVIPWNANLSALIAQGADPETGVIAFTVTEAGYYLDTSFKLDQTNPDLKADLKGAMTTIYGAVAAIVRERKKRNGGGVTLLSCDNVRHNGERFRSGMEEFFELTGDLETLAWFRENTLSPCCMVDRITPRPSPDIAVRVKEATGFDDMVPVMGESFIQWVVEDDFKAGRPVLEKVGVEMVDDVQPYEEAKIRLLNVPHAGIAWAGTLLGLNYIHEGTLTPSIRQMSYDYVTDDVIPCLTPCPLDLASYRDTVLDRFTNANILDTNQRVAADGLSKIPAMITPTLAACYAAGRTPRATLVLSALFFVFMRRWAEGKLPYAYQDGILDPAAMKALYAEADPIAAYASDAALYGDLAGRADFIADMRAAVVEAERFDTLG